MHVPAIHLKPDFTLNHPLLEGYDSNNYLCSLAQDPGRSGPAVEQRMDHSLVTPVVLGGVLWIYPRGDPTHCCTDSTHHAADHCYTASQGAAGGVTPQTRSKKFLHVILAQ